MATLAAMLLTLAGVATAQTGDRGPAKAGRVAVLASGRDAAAAARIAAELRAFGFAPQVRMVESAPDVAEGERALRGGAQASVQLDGRAGKTQVLIAAQTGQTIRAPVVLAGTPGAIDPVLIVRTVELVRAALLHPAAVSREPAASNPPATPPVPAASVTAPRPAPPPPPPTALPPAALPPSAATTAPAAIPSPPPSTTASPVSAPPLPPAADAVRPPTEATPLELPRPPPGVAPDARRWRTGVSTGIAAASGGLAPEVVLHAQVSMRIGGPLHAEVFGVAPLTSSPTSTAAGSSRSTAWLAGTGATARSRNGPFLLEAGAGALAVWLRSTGTPAVSSQPLIGAADSALGAAAYGRLGAALPLGHTLAARVDLLAGDVFRRTVIGFGSVTHPAAWGPAFLIVVAGLDLRW